MLTLRGGAELVAAWAQLASVIELVAGVALAGLGTGISVLVAQSGRPDQQRALLRESLRLGLGVSVPVMFAVAAACWFFADAVAGGGIPRSLLVLSAASGCIAVVPGMLNGYWLGQQRRDLMLALALATAALPFLGSISASRDWILAAVVVAQALPALVAPLVIRAGAYTPLSPSDWEQSRRMLRRYLAPGLAIGILSPASMLLARSIVSGAMSWHDVGLLQALWRVSDAVTAIAGGFMAVHFLPRLSAAHGTPQFALELKRTTWVTVVPAGVVLAILAIFQQPIIFLLYGPEFRIPDASVILLFAGTLARIASWAPLFGLYAMRRTRPIAAGELLSLPLFAALLFLFREDLTLERASAMWLAAYLAYWLFNRWMVIRN